ncbi:MAG TPA: XdhC family protein [Bacillota bacterium]|nr:XdhC family protein [Bacillota bacterium]
MISKKLYKKLSEAVQSHENVALITITDHPDQSMISQKLLLYSNNDVYYEAPFEQSFINELKDKSIEVLEGKQIKTIHIDVNDVTVECYVETFAAPPKLIVAGAGHVSESVSQMAKMLGFHVTIIDDREEYSNRKRFPEADEVVCTSYIEFFRHVPIDAETYVLLLTRGHKFDVVSLQEMLSREEEMAEEDRCNYIGMIGSRRRIAGVFEQLKDEFTEHNFVNIYSPVGLDVGAQTPAEIAVSILAEILKIKNNTTGKSLKKKIRSYSQLKFRERKDRKERVTG